MPFYLSLSLSLVVCPSLWVLSLLFYRLPWVDKESCPRVSPRIFLLSSPHPCCPFFLSIFFLVSSPLLIPLSVDDGGIFSAGRQSLGRLDVFHISCGKIYRRYGCGRHGCTSLGRCVCVRQRSRLHPQPSPPRQRWQSELPSPNQTRGGLLIPLPSVRRGCHQSQDHLPPSVLQPPRCLYRLPEGTTSPSIPCSNPHNLLLIAPFLTVRRWGLPLRSWTASPPWLRSWK